MDTSEKEKGESFELVDISKKRLEIKDNNNPNTVIVKIISNFMVTFIVGIGFLLAFYFLASKFEKMGSFTNPNINNNLHHELIQTRDTIKEYEYKIQILNLQVQVEKLQNKKMIQQYIDSLSTQLINEICGSGISKKPGYGKNAVLLKQKIDSLKHELKIY